MNHRARRFADGQVAHAALHLGRAAMGIDLNFVERSWHGWCHAHRVEAWRRRYRARAALRHRRINGVAASFEQHLFISFEQTTPAAGAGDRRSEPSSHRAWSVW